MDTIAFIPGSFAPPHSGHLDMIRHYSNECDYVIVVVSNPQNASRRDLAGGKHIDPSFSAKILNRFKRAYGLDNVKVVVSDVPSPVKYVMASIEKLRRCRVVVGLSDKDGEAVKYDWIPDAVDPGPGVEVIKPSDTAFHAVSSDSSRDIRRDMSRYAEFLPAGVSAD